MRTALWWSGALAVGALVLAAAAGRADDKKGVKVGDPAPSFEAKDDAGKLWKSGEHVGKKPIVVFFFPAAFTGGWTTQCCAFRDESKKFEQLGVEVVGVSGDTPETQAMFKKEHQLPFTLLGDVDGRAAKALGVTILRQGGDGKAKVDGKEVSFKRGAMPARWTFVIGKDGKILYKNESVKPKEDAAQVLAVLEKAK